jgi:signal transduction histidine kinase
MQRRILSVVLPLLVLAAGLTGFLIGRGTAERLTRAAYVARLNDATTLADGAETALRTGQVSAVGARLERYEEVYGATVLVYDGDLELLAASTATNTEQRASSQPVATEALEGVRRDSTPMVVPWDDRPMLIAAPIGNDRRVDGAVVIIWPTARLRSMILTRWLTLAGAMLASLLLFALLARPLARWVLRPVNDLDETAHALAEGNFAARVPHHSGPPELRRLANNFNEMADAMSTAVQRERVFAADASHHIGSVLTALRLRVELLEGHVDDDGGELRSEVLHEVDRMQEVIDGLLVLASSHERQIDAAMIDIAVEVDGRIAAWRDTAALHHCRLIRHGEQRCEAYVPPGIVGHLIDLLLDNACKYGGGYPITVTLTAPRSASGNTSAGTVTVSVSDAGPGLPDHELQQATGRFWRSTHHQNVPGTGLGLAVAQELISACGGTLEIHNESPSGLTVTLNVPSRPPPADSRPKHPGAAATAR